VGRVRNQSTPSWQNLTAYRWRSQATRSDKRCRCPIGAAIAVLPFSNMSGDPEQEYFSDGISEDIITALSKLRWFFVIARNSSFICKGKAVHMKQVADELGVGYVLEGSVRKAGDSVRITAQLNDATTGSHIWAERYDRRLADIFAVQDEITEAIVAAIEPHVYAAENFRAQRKPPDSLDAWDLVMRGLSHFWRVTRQDNIVAQALLEKAIEIDPNYGQAHGVLSSCHTFSAHWVGRTWRPSCRLPSKRPWRRSGRTARTRGRARLWAASICSGGVLRTRWPSSNWRYASTRIFRSHLDIMVLCLPTAAAGRKARRPPTARCV
jgi:TolB-like protein